MLRGAKVTGEEKGRGRGHTRASPRRAPQAKTRLTPGPREGGQGAGCGAGAELEGWVYFIVFCLQRWAGDTLSRGRQKACCPGVLPRWEGGSPPGLVSRGRGVWPLWPGMGGGITTPTADPLIGALPPCKFRGWGELRIDGLPVAPRLSPPDPGHHARCQPPGTRLPSEKRFWVVARVPEEEGKFKPGCSWGKGRGRRGEKTQSLIFGTPSFLSTLAGWEPRKAG